MIKRTLFAMALALACLAGAATGPADRHVRIRREPVVEPRSICRERARIENRHRACAIGVVVVRTRYLVSGKERERFVVHVPPRARRELGCSWWPGAMRRTEFELLRAWYARCQEPNESEAAAGSAP